MDQYSDQRPHNFREQIGEAVGYIGCLTMIAAFATAGYFALKSASEQIKQSIDEDAKKPRKVINGIITKEAIIPLDISERARKEFPYWLLVDTDEGPLKINFDTDDPFYDPSKPDEHRSGITIKFSAGEDYTNKSLDLDALLDVGDRVFFKTREDNGIIREAYKITKIEKKAK